MLALVPCGVSQGPQRPPQMGAHREWSRRHVVRSLGHLGARSQRRVGAGLRDMRAWPGRAHSSRVASASSPDAAGEGGVHHRPSSLRPFLTPLPFPVSTWGDPSRCGVSLTSLNAQRTPLVQAPNQVLAVPTPAPQTLVPPVTLSLRSQPAWQHPCICPFHLPGHRHCPPCPHSPRCRLLPRRPN